MPFNNPFFNGEILSGLKEDNSPIENVQHMFRRKNLDFSSMSKRQQKKIKNMLEARAAYLSMASSKMKTESVEQVGIVDESLEVVVAKREEEKEKKRVAKIKKDILFRNEFVFE